MTALLVSVRSAAEASSALRGGAAVIDMKEPARGPLGPVDPAAQRAIIREVRGRSRIAAALGELREVDSVPLLPVGVHFAKWGLSGLRGSRWQPVWEGWAAQLPAGTLPVAVVYADADRAHAPDAEEVLEVAAAHGRVVLIDTFCKTSGSGLLRSWSIERLERLVRRARASKLDVALAGSIGCRDLERILRLRPDLIGVRGAACCGGRAGTVHEPRVRRLVRRIAGVPGSPRNSPFSLFFR